MGEECYLDDVLPNLVLLVALDLSRGADVVH